MARISRNKIVVAIDVGTTKISVLVGNVLDEGQVEVIGVGYAPSTGLEKGVVVDVAKTVYAIKKAAQEAELMSGITIESACIGISGSHITSFSSMGMVAIKKSRVTSHDVEQVIAAARAIPLSEGQHILHAIPTLFYVDGHPVDDPRDMYGVRLEVRVHLILASVACVQNLIKCCESAGIQVIDIVLEQLASAQAVLTEEEKDVGIAMIDIGGGTSDVAVYRRGQIAYTMVVPVAGNHFTSDLSIGLCISRSEAERIKRIAGCVQCKGGSRSDALCLETNVEAVKVDGAHTDIISHHDIARIMYPRAKELMSLIYNKLIKEEKLAHLMTAGIVLTGGGALLHGLSECTQEIFKVSTRVGVPLLAFDAPHTLATPQYATAYGLLKYAARTHSHNNQLNMQWNALVNRMKAWITQWW